MGEMIHIDIKKLGFIDGIGQRITPSRGLRCNPLPGNGRPHRPEQRALAQGRQGLGVPASGDR